MNPDIIQSITVLALPLIFAITLHEAAHAYAARYFGDATAYMMGRMTLNPVKHIDPVWTIAVPLVLALLHLPVIGAARPVPVNFDALRNPKRDSIFVAAAGPFANLAMMILWAVVARVALTGEGGPAQFLTLMGLAGVQINALLMFINLLPILPLDGGRIVAGLLPDALSYKFSKLEPYGMFIVIALLMTPALDFIVRPLVDGSTKSIYAIIGLSY